LLDEGEESETSNGYLYTGFRCGDDSLEPTFWLDVDVTWERALFQADGGLLRGRPPSLHLGIGSGGP
jgi:hypothetical protein